MTKEMIFELIGYLGSILVLVSMLMTSVMRLRIINLVGSAIFTAYALLIHSYPTALLNAFLVVINIVQIVRLTRKQNGEYEVQPIGKNEGFSEWFLRRNLEDIRHFFPDLDPEEAARAEGFAVFFETQPAGLLLGTRSGETFEILLDYTTPGYRDCSVGTFLYEALPAYGITRIACRSDTPEHVNYMEKMGFTEEGGTYVKSLPAKE